MHASYVLSSIRPPLPVPPKKGPTKEEKQQAFNNLLQNMEASGLSKFLFSHNKIQPETSDTPPESLIPQPPTISYASIKYYKRVSPQTNNANELIIVNDGIPKIFLKRYNQEESPVSLNLYPSDINLLEQIYHEAKKMTEEPPSFIITIDSQSYGIQYLTLNNDSRSLGEQIQDITDITSPDNARYALIIDQNNIVTLKDLDDQCLLVRCTERQFNHITTTELQFCITVLDSDYAITTINNNGTIKELLVKKEPSYEPLPSVDAKPESTKEEKIKYKKMMKKLGFDKETTTSTIFTQEDPASDKPISFPFCRPVFIGCIGMSIVAIATLIYFFLDTYPQHQ